MKITTQEVSHVARLARLEFTEAETQTFTTQLNNILLYMEMLNRVDTAGVAPMSHAIAQTNAFREDIVTPSPGREATLANAPDTRGDFFRVPKVID